MMQYCLGGDPVYVGTSVGVFKVGASVTIHDIYEARATNVLFL